MTKRQFVRLIMFVLLVTGVVSAADRNRSVIVRPELRAIWVDGFHPGIRTSEEVAQLITDAKKGNLNALIVQVRHRGNAYYTKSIVPPVEEASYDPGFEALACIIDRAHKEGIEVHAWINAMPTWRNVPPPKDPRHAFNQHGPSATGRDMWLTASPDGKKLFPVGYFLDPVHPDAEAYMADVYTNVIKSRPGLDGIHFDSIRYPETEEKTASKLGAPVGYNRVSIERFQHATHRTDIAAPDDQRFILWRREQVTQLVRRLYLQAKESNPRIRVNAAAIPWGRAPKDEKDFANFAPMQRVFQNWAGELKEGILDTAVPMNYAREGEAVSRGFDDGWIKFEKKDKSGRSVVVGIGGYLNTPEQVLDQINRTRVKDGKYAADGVSIFSYFSLAKHAPRAAPPAEVVPAAFSGSADLVTFTEDSDSAKPVFPSPAPAPHCDWLDKPDTGWLAGFVRGANGKPADGAVVELSRAGEFPLFGRTRRGNVDGNGFYDFSKIEPGRYVITLVDNHQAKIESRITAGKVSKAGLVAR